MSPTFRIELQGGIMDDSKTGSSEALYRLVNNTDRPNSMRREALQELITRQEIGMLESIMNNPDRPTWMRDMALEGLKSIK